MKLWGGGGVVEGKEMKRWLEVGRAGMPGGGRQKQGSQTGLDQKWP